MSDDRNLKLLKYLALGTVGVYLLQTYRAKGTLDGSFGDAKITIDTDRLVDTVMPWVDLPDTHRELVRIGAKEFARKFKKGSGP
jgi:hypothetical protein